MELATCLYMNTAEQEARELAHGLRRRDPSLIEHLIHQYQHRLYRYLLMLTGGHEKADDLFQETWVRVLEKGHQYNHRWRFETWLFTIARNLTIDSMRRRQPQSLDSLLEPDSSNRPMDIEDPAPTSAFDMALRSEESHEIASALNRLHPAYREVLTLRFHEDMKLEEIAQVIHAPLSTVKSRLYRGLEALRNLLEGKEE